MPDFFTSANMDDLANLVEKGTGKSFGDGQRWQFDDCLNEAALAFRNAPFERAPRRKGDQRKARALAGRARKLASDIVSFTCGLGWRSDVTPFLSVAEILEKIAALQVDPKDWRFLTTVFHLAHAWGVLGPVGISSEKPDNTRKGGPFIRFVRDALHMLEPDGNWQHRSGESIRDAVKIIRSVAG